MERSPPRRHAAAFGPNSKRSPARSLSLMRRKKAVSGAKCARREAANHGGQSAGLPPSAEAGGAGCARSFRQFGQPFALASLDTSFNLLFRAGGETNAVEKRRARKNKTIKIREFPVRHPGSLGQASCEGMRKLYTKSIPKTAEGNGWPPWEHIMGSALAREISLVERTLEALCLLLQHALAKRKRLHGEAEMITRDITSVLRGASILTCSCG